MVDPSTQKSILAILFSSLTLISQMSPSKCLTRGIPSGQPKWTVFMSSPITLRSWGESDLSQSLTGSLPLSDLKKQTFKMGFISSECTIFDTLSQMMRLARSCEVIQVVIIKK